MRQKGYASGTTNRVLILLRYIYNLGRKWRVAGMVENPTLGLSTAPDVQRDRFLTAEETQRLIAAIQSDENQTAAQAIMLLLLTGGRRNEITQAKWEYVNWERRTLLVPLSKSGKPRAIALNGQALALLRAIPRHDGNPFIFPSPVNGKPSASLFFPGTASASAPASPMSGCTICGTPMRASWSTRGSRSTSCRGCSGMRIRAPRSATLTSRTKPCWRPQSASPTWWWRKCPPDGHFSNFHGSAGSAGTDSDLGYALGCGCGIHADSARSPRHKHKFSVNSGPNHAGGLPSRHLGGGPARRNGAPQRSEYSTAFILRIHERARQTPRTQIFTAALFDRPAALDLADLPQRLASKPELRLEQVVHRLRIGLAAGGLHHLADEPAEQLSASPSPAPTLSGFLRDDLVDDLLDRAECR